MQAMLMQKQDTEKHPCKLISHSLHTTIIGACDIPCRPCMNLVPYWYAIYKTQRGLVRKHTNVAFQAAHNVLMIVDTTQQPLALITFPTSACVAKL